MRHGELQQTIRENAAQGETQRRTLHLKRTMERAEHVLHQRETRSPPATQQYMQPNTVHVPPPLTGHKPKSLLLGMEQYFAVVMEPDVDRLSRIVPHLSGSASEHSDATAERSPMFLARTWDDF